MLAWHSTRRLILSHLPSAIKLRQISGQHLETREVKAKIKSVNDFFVKIFIPVEDEARMVPSCQREVFMKGVETSN